MESHKCQATDGIQGYQKWCFLRVAAEVGMRVVAQGVSFGPPPQPKETRPPMLKSEPRETGTRGEDGHPAARPEPWDGNCLGTQRGRCRGRREGGSEGRSGIGRGGPALLTAGCAVLVALRVRRLGEDEPPEPDRGGIECLLGGMALAG